MGRHSTKIDEGDISFLGKVDVLTPPESPPSKKRKRDDHPVAEIEVDITAPEPPSKKALRKAKRESKNVLKTTTTEGSKQKTNAEKATLNEDSGASEKPPNRSEYGIWIGNLSWTTTKNELREFFAKNMSDAAASITRLHLPPPRQATLTNSQQKQKPQNKGFAYVDFSGETALEEALTLSEKLFSGRKVLIKDAKSFEGRPEKPVGKAGKENDALSGKPPSERIFVGNLRFETTNEEIREHFTKCGVVEDVFLTTFEDSGKCKGYGWVTFRTVEAAEKAVRGWVELGSDAEAGEGSEEGDADADEGLSDMNESRKRLMGREQKVQKKAKARKWWVNRLQGRPLRMEFAEGKDVRYKKRYGKGGTAAQNKAIRDGSAADGALTGPEEAQLGNKARKRPLVKIDVKRKRPEKVDARTIRPGAALAAAPRLTGGIVESKGKKIIFES